MARQTLSDAAKAAFKALTGAGVIAIRIVGVRNVTVSEDGTEDEFDATIALDTKSSGTYTVETGDAFGALRTLTYFGLPLIEPGKSTQYGKNGTISRSAPADSTPAR